MNMKKVQISCMSSCSLPIVNTLNKIVLSAFLLTAYIPIYTNTNNEARIEELEAALLQKEYEISSLGEKIDAKVRLIRSIDIDMCADLEQRVSQLKLEDQELEELRNSIYAGGKEFEKIIKDALFLTKDIKGILLKEFFDHEKPLAKNFVVQKFWALRTFFEDLLLKHLVKRYEVCIQQAIQINNEIETLQSLQ